MMVEETCHVTRFDDDDDDDDDDDYDNDDDKQELIVCEVHDDDKADDDNDDDDNNDDDKEEKLKAHEANDDDNDDDDNDNDDNEEEGKPSGRGVTTGRDAGILRLKGVKALAVGFSESPLLPECSTFVGRPPTKLLDATTFLVHDENT
nr:hypothetical protein BaRGS_003672 [Batillaria attramentaria]